MRYAFVISWNDLRAPLALLAFFLLTASSNAATPSDAFQRAEHLGLIVEKLLKADLVAKGMPQDPAKSSSRPRHVLRLATNAFESVQLVRDLNGLGVQGVPKTTATEVTPDDVVSVLDRTIKSAQELGPVYNVSLDITAPTREEGKTPDDVLARLRAVNVALIHLGAPKVLPNDVYRVAKGIEEQVSQMAKKLNIEGGVEVTHIDKASPADALQEAVLLVDELESLSKSSEKFNLPKGVIRPPLPAQGAKVTPSDVLLAAQYALADVYSLSVVLGNKEPMNLPPPQAGRNPADVKNSFASARAYLHALKALR